MDFEKHIFELETKIKELQHLSSSNINVSDDVKKLQAKLEKALIDLYKKLSPWEKVLVARQPNRPQSTDYINSLFSDFVPLSGDRLFAEDTAIIAGIARFKEQSVFVIGHNKGKETDERIRNHFGMPMPEGYRKAERLMKLANKFAMPIITFIDTSGAFPGIEAEERGQAEAIASCIETSLHLDVPVISVVIGEGGSGGAIAIGVANAVLMLEHSVYSVISPEGCASILWKSLDATSDAANVLKITAQDLLKLGIIDAIVEEPIGAAHRDPEKAIADTGIAISNHLANLNKITDLKAHRQEKFLRMSRIA